MAKRKKVSELEEDARQIAALQAEASEGKRSPTRQLIPIRVVENVQLPSLSSDAIKRRRRMGTLDEVVPSRNFSLAGTTGQPPLATICW